MIRIISDGTAPGTNVFTAKGEKLKNISRIEIEPLAPGGIVRARLTVEMVALDIIAAEGSVEVKPVTGRHHGKVIDASKKQRETE